MTESPTFGVAGQLSFPAPRIRCREIEDADTDDIARLLTKSGFSDSKEYWQECLRRLSHHPTPAGYPKYGFLLEVNRIAVGVLLLITKKNTENNAIKCNVSSWFVWPAFRIYAPLLVKRALSCPNVTYYNLSPYPHTIQTLIVQGYKLYCRGQYVALPLLGSGASQGRAGKFVAPLRTGADLSQYEIELLADHDAYGCLSVIVTVAGKRHPFVFQVRRKFRIMRVAYLIYCHDIQNLIEFAKPIGRFFAKRAIFLVVIDANGPIDGLVGRYRKSTPKYFKGPTQPQLGDFSYSERVLFRIG